VTHQLFVLILLSSAIHAWWNFVLKRAGGGIAFVALSKLVEVALGAIPFVLWSGVSGDLIRRHGFLLAVGGLLTLLSYAFLTLAYRREQMSTVYAISRGGSLALLPALAWVFRGERMDGLGFAAMGTIILGIALMQVPALTRKALFQALAAIRNPAAHLAWLAAFTIAGYGLWDALAVRSLPPFFYFYGYTVLVALGLLAFVLVKPGPRTLGEVWARQRWPAIQVALGNSLSYILFLFALRLGKTAYVNAVRQLGIPVGAWMGWRFLEEPMGIPKRIGLAAIVGGCLLVSLAR
jgi:uncharacterized membrane protein